MDAKLTVSPNKLTAIVFLSKEYHGVRSILGGIREMFTTELWRYRNVPVGIRRPSIDDYYFFKQTGAWTPHDINLEELEVERQQTFLYQEEQREQREEQREQEEEEEQQREREQQQQE